MLRKTKFHPEQKKTKTFSSMKAKLTLKLKKLNQVYFNKTTYL